MIRCFKSKVLQNDIMYSTIDCDFFFQILLLIFLSIETENFALATRCRNPEILDLRRMLLDTRKKLTLRNVPVRLEKNRASSGSRHFLPHN